MSKSSKKSKVNIGGIVRAVLIGIAATIIMLLIAAGFLESGKLKEDKLRIFIIAINITAAVICGIVASLSSGEGKSLNGMISGAIYAGLIILISFLTDLGEIENSEILRIFTISVLFSFIGSKLNLLKSNKKFRKKRKR